MTEERDGWRTDLSETISQIELWNFKNGLEKFVESSIT